MNAASSTASILAGWAVYSALLYFVARAAIGRFGQRWPVGLAIAAALPLASALWVWSQREERRRIDWDFSDMDFLMAGCLFVAGLPGVMLAIFRAGGR